MARRTDDWLESEWPRLDPALKYLLVQASTTTAGWLIGLLAVLPYEPTDLPEPIDSGTLIVPFGHLVSAAACTAAAGFGAFAPKEKLDVAAVALLAGGSACLNPFSPLDTVTPLLVAWLLNAYVSVGYPRPKRAARWPWLVLPLTFAVGAEVQWVATQVYAFKHVASHPFHG